MTTKKKSARKTVRVNVPSRKTAPSEVGARLFKLTDVESEEVARVLLLQLALHGPTSKKSARRCVVAAAVVAVDAGVPQADFLRACAAEYLRAAYARKQWLVHEKEQRAAARRAVAKSKSS